MYFHLEMIAEKENVYVRISKFCFRLITLNHTLFTKYSMSKLFNKKQFLHSTNIPGDKSLIRILLIHLALSSKSNNNMKNLKF